jgi:hypothetical protein
MYLHIILARSKDSTVLLSPLMKKYYFILTILLIGCGENQNTFKFNNLTYTYTYGNHSGRLVLSGNSPLDSGMFTLLDTQEIRTDTSFGKYYMIDEENLKGISKDSKTIIFTLYPDLDSGYLFNEKAIKIRKYIH